MVGYILQNESGELKQSWSNLSSRIRKLICNHAQSYTKFGGQRSISQIKHGVQYYSDCLHIIEDSAANFEHLLIPKIERYTSLKMQISFLND